MRSRVLAVAGLLLASVSLAACGDDSNDTAAEMTPTGPTMQAAPPTMQATPPTMQANPPAMAATVPGIPLTIAEITGHWAADVPACSAPTEITTITETAFTGGGMDCTVTATEPTGAGVNVTLSCVRPIAPEPVIETWGFTAEATPIDAVNVNIAGDMMTFARCP